MHMSILIAALLLGASSSGVVAQDSDIGWTYHENINRLDGRNLSRYEVLSEDAKLFDKRGEFQDFEGPFLLIGRCTRDGGGFEFDIASSRDIFSPDGKVPVRYRFGDNEVVEENWNLQFGTPLIALPNGYNDFKRGLLSEDSVIFEYISLSRSHSAVFEKLSANRSALIDLMNECSK